MASAIVITTAFVLCSLHRSKPILLLSVINRKGFFSLGQRHEFFDWLVDIRRKIHQNPDVGFNEYETSDLIRSELDALGTEYAWPVSRTHVVASIWSGDMLIFSL